MGGELLRNIRKEFLIEFRNPSAVLSAFSFSGVATISVSLVTRALPLQPLVQSILLWLIIFFTAMNSLLHPFIREEDHGTAPFLRLHSSALSVLASKLVFNAVLFFSLQLIITPLAVVFFQFTLRSPFFFLVTLLCGGFAVTATVTVLSAIVARSGGRGPLFTIISFPLLLPILWMSIESTRHSLERGGFWDVRSLVFLLAFSGMIIALSFLLIRFIWLDE
ncbi:MAG: heme exporter protein CcmB [Spirochaetes bacterium]|nr:heme exporter protein CcmB [Spirochaetota bacterium]